MLGVGQQGAPMGKPPRQSPPRSGASVGPVSGTCESRDLGGYGRGGQLYRYYVSSPPVWGVERGMGDRGIRRIPVDAIELVVRGALERLVRRPGAPTPAPRRIELQEDELHLCIAHVALFTSHADPGKELERLRRRLREGERAILDEHDAAAVRIILPVRLKLRGGRTWMTAPDGRPAVHAGVDKTLVSAPRTD